MASNHFYALSSGEQEAGSMGKGVSQCAWFSFGVLTAHSLCDLDHHWTSLDQLFIFKHTVLRYVKCLELRMAE